MPVKWRIKATYLLTSLTGDSGIEEVDIDKNNERELNLHEQLEMVMNASQCPPASVSFESLDMEKEVMEAIKTEMQLFSCTGCRGCCLQLVHDYLMTIPPTSVEAESFLSCGYPMHEVAITSRRSLSRHTLLSPCFLWCQD